MINFGLAILQYLLIAVVILAIGCVGAAVGVMLRKNKDKKNQSSKDTE